MPKQSKEQKETVQRVMHEFNHGELKRGRDGGIKNPKQVIAIALHEAGASKYESPKQNRENLRKTKEHRGETVQQRSECKRTPGRQSQGGSAKEKSNAELCDEAKRRNVFGRSRMSKDELARALSRQTAS